MSYRKDVRVLNNLKAAFDHISRARISCLTATIEDSKDEVVITKELQSLSAALEDLSADVNSAVTHVATRVNAQKAESEKAKKS